MVKMCSKICSKICGKICGKICHKIETLSDWKQKLGVVVDIGTPFIKNVFFVV